MAGLAPSAAIAALVYGTLPDMISFAIGNPAAVILDCSCVDCAGVRPAMVKAIACRRSTVSTFLYESVENSDNTSKLKVSNRRQCRQVRFRSSYKRERGYIRKFSDRSVCPPLVLV